MSLYFLEKKKLDFLRKYFLLNIISTMRFTLMIDLGQVEVICQHKQLLLTTEIFF